MEIYNLFRIDQGDNQITREYMGSFRTREGAQSDIDLYLGSRISGLETVIDFIEKDGGKPIDTIMKLEHTKNNEQVIIIDNKKYFYPIWEIQPFELID